MKIFGYQKNGESLLQMEEVSMECDLSELDDVIDFFKSIRNLMHQHQGDFYHMHYKDWRKQQDRPMIEGGGCNNSE